MAAARYKEIEELTSSSLYAGRWAVQLRVRRQLEQSPSPPRTVGGGAVIVLAG